MRHLSISGYLTEKKLCDTIADLVGDDWIGTQVSLPGSRRKFDFAYVLNGQQYLTEYDGDDHYRSTWVIRGDREKSALARQHSYELVRVPYWVQLDTETLDFFFGIEAEIEQDFPHGFITTKIFPASFCEIGVKRFEAELGAIPARIRQEVISSLEARCADYGAEYVLPSGLRHLVG